MTRVRSSVWGAIRKVSAGSVAATAVVLCTVAIAAPAAQRWITFSNSAVDLMFDYPAGIFSEAMGDPTDTLGDRTHDRAGRIFATPDGRAVLQFGTFPNLDKLSVAELRKRAITASYGDAKIDYNRATDTWYVLSGTRGADTFYERVQFSCGGRRLDLFSLTYPTVEETLYSDVIDEMARRARPVYARNKCTEQ